MLRRRHMTATEDMGCAEESSEKHGLQWPNEAY